MLAMIKSDSIRVDDNGSTLRLLVSYSDFPGYHGIQVSLPTTKQKVKEAILQTGNQIQEMISRINAWKADNSDILDVEIEIS